MLIKVWFDGLGTLTDRFPIIKTGITTNECFTCFTVESHGGRAEKDEKLLSDSHVASKRPDFIPGSVSGARLIPSRNQSRK